MSDHAAFKLKLDEFFAQRHLSDVWTWLMLNEDAGREEIEERLEERLRWAHAHRNDPEYATEANFLLNYMDEIRAELLPGAEWEEDSSTVVVERPSAPKVVAARPLAADPTMMPGDFDDPFAPVASGGGNIANLAKDPVSKGRPASFSIADTADDRPTDPGLKGDPHTASIPIPVLAPVAAAPAPVPTVAPVVAAAPASVPAAAPAPVDAASPAAAAAPPTPPTGPTPYPTRAKAAGPSGARIILIGGGLLIGAAVAFFAVTRLFHVEPGAEKPGATAPATTAPATPPVSTAPATTPPPATPPTTPNPASTGPRPVPNPGTLPAAAPATPGAKPPAATPTPTTPPATTAPTTKPATTGTTTKPATTGTTTRPTTTTGTTTRPETTAASTEVVCLAKGSFRGSSGENRVSLSVSSIKGRGVSGTASITTAGGTKSYPYSGICTGSTVRLIADGQIFLSGNVSGNGSTVSGTFRWGDQSGQMTLTQR